MPKIQIELGDDVDIEVESIQAKLKYANGEDKRPSKKEVIERALRWLLEEQKLEEAVKGGKRG